MVLTAVYLLWYRYFSGAQLWTTYTFKDVFDSANFIEYFSTRIPVFVGEMLPFSVFALSVLVTMSVYTIWRDIGAYRFREIGCLIVSAAFNFVVAYALYFTLYEPECYVLFPFLATCFLIVPVFAQELVKHCESFVHFPPAVSCAITTYKAHLFWP